MQKPLEGLRIIDLTHMLSGPYGAMILADLGADTVKVEPPENGENTRRLLASDPKNSIDGMGAYFFTLNRNKRSVALDLKYKQDLDRFYSLVGVADIVISNFSPGVTKKLGVDYSSLSDINPKIITGDSPEQAMRAGIPIGDLGGGMFAVMGILAAVNARNTTGRGQHVDISMLDCQISMLNYMATMHSMSGDIPQPLGNSHFVHVPYNTFKTKTDLIVLALVGDKFWPDLVGIIDDQALRAPHFAQGPARLAAKEFIEAQITAALAHQDADYWLQRLEQANIPCARVNNMAQAMRDPQVLARNMIVDIAHPIEGGAKAPGNPIKLSDTNGDSYSPPPLLGAHNQEVFREWLGDE